jgi:hypothetical protein
MVGTNSFNYNISLILHADWSIDSKKRVACSAHLQENGYYRIYAPELVSDISALFRRIRNRIGDHDCAVVGFDFPIGLPLRYAQLSGIDDFLEQLPRFGKGDWFDFYNVAEIPNEISIHRPFYPSTPGSSQQDHLIKAIGVANANELRRICEKRTSNRRAASPLFWTLGPQQVGKAAIIGWRDMLAPGLVDASLNLSIWPFSGKFEDQCKNRIVVVETYPAEFYTHFGITFGKYMGGGKRQRQARARWAPVIRKWAIENQIELDAALSVQMDEGFSSTSFDDDGFDAFIGVIGMLNVIVGNRSPGAPESQVINNIEGWIFGQSFI